VTRSSFARSVEQDVARAGFTPAERLAFYAASVKWPDELTRADVALLNRYEATKHQERVA
jgi:hypothetical protein